MGTATIHKAKGIIALEVTCGNCSEKFYLHVDQVNDHMFEECSVCHYQSMVEIEDAKTCQPV